MADSIDRILIQYGIDQSALEGDKQQLLAKIRSIAQEAAKVPLAPSGEAAGESFGKGFSKVSEREVKKGFRDIRDGAVLLFSFLGSFLGTTFSDKLGESAKGAFTGALAGLGVGAFFGPAGIAIGAGVGALLGGITGYIDQIRKEGKAIEDLAAKYSLSHESAKKLFDITTQIGGKDQFGNVMERWSKLMDEIISKNPEVIRALKTIGLTAEEIATLSPLTLRGKLLIDTLTAMTAVPLKASEFESYNDFIHSMTGKRNDFSKMLNTLTTPEVKEYFQNNPPSRFLMEAKDFENLLTGFKKEDARNIIQTIDRLYGNLDNFVKEFNALAFKPYLQGKMTSTDLFSGNFGGTLPADSFIAVIQQELKLIEQITKQAEEYGKKWEKLKQLSLEQLDIETQLNVLYADRAALQKAEKDPDKEVERLIKIEELNKRITELQNKQTTEIQKQTDEQEKRIGELLKSLNEIDDAINKGVKELRDKISFSLNDLSTGGMTDAQKRFWQQLLAPNFFASPEAVNNALARQKQWEASWQFQNDLNNPQGRGWFIRAAQQVELWEAQAKQLNLVGNLQGAIELQKLAADLRAKIDPLGFDDRMAPKKSLEQLTLLNDQFEYYLGLAEEKGVRIVPNMGE